MQYCIEINKHHNQRALVNHTANHPDSRAPAVRGGTLSASALIVGALAVVLLLIAFTPPATPTIDTDRSQLQSQARAGEPSAQLLLGLAYRDGRYGLERNSAAARTWLRRAAEADNGYAAAALGDLYAAGNDATQALRWWRRAADAGDDHGAEQLRHARRFAAPDVDRPQDGSALAGRYPTPWTLIGIVRSSYRLFRRLDPGGQAAETLQRRAAGNDAIAQFQLAMRYRDGGMGLERDARKALYWLRRSADQGNAIAMDALATAYRNGTLGLTPDSVRAQRWSDRAARLQGETQDALNNDFALAPTTHF